jgi:hypothetical protein
MFEEFWLLVSWIGCRVHEEHEVPRVREVLEPVGEAGLGLRLLVADRREVDDALDDLGSGLEPICSGRRRGTRSTGCDGSSSLPYTVTFVALGAGLLDQLLRLCDVRGGVGSPYGQSSIFS